MSKTIKGLKISALAVMLTGLSGCNEPRHPVYGFTQLDPYLAIFVVFAVFAVGSFLWGSLEYDRFPQESYQSKLSW